MSGKRRVLSQSHPLRAVTLDVADWKKFRRQQSRSMDFRSKSVSPSLKLEDDSEDSDFGVLSMKLRQYIYKRADSDHLECWQGPKRIGTISEFDISEITGFFIMKIKIHEAGTVEQRLPKFLKKRIIKLKELARLMGIRFVMPRSQNPHKISQRRRTTLRTHERSRSRSNSPESRTIVSDRSSSSCDASATKGWMGYERMQAILDSERRQNPYPTDTPVFSDSEFEADSKSVPSRKSRPTHKTTGSIGSDSTFLGLPSRVSNITTRIEIDHDDRDFKAFDSNNAITQGLNVESDEENEVDEKAEWFYKAGGEKEKVIGPLQSSRMRYLLEQGTINSFTEVWNISDGEKKSGSWSTVSKTPELLPRIPVPSISRVVARPTVYESESQQTLKLSTSVGTMNKTGEIRKQKVSQYKAQSLRARMNRISRNASVDIVNLRKLSSEEDTYLSIPDLINKVIRALSSRYQEAFILNLPNFSKTT
ncbi:hypothetical protein AAMO2058_001024900, partial [Amorphochlora amoebiformis]